MHRRRHFIGLLAGATAALASRPALSAPKSDFSLAGLRGSIDAAEHGLRQTTDDQSAALNRLIAEASARGKPLFLPPGTYSVSGLVLPDFSHLTGVPGATRLLYTGGGFMLSARQAETVRLSGLVIDGANRWLDDATPGLMLARDVAHLVVEDCEIAGSGKFALYLEGCGGRIEANRISGAAQSGIYALESRGLAIRDNEIAACANGGILVHRWKKGADGTLLSGNRISRIGAAAGGTGQNGNGINIFRADDVSVTGNHVSDCAFSAVRANSSGNILISTNQCLRSGETAIYSEFAFEGAVVSANIVDGAANGISIANFNEGGRLSTVSGNIVRNLSAKGPYPAEGPGFGWGIAAEADTAITGNTIEAVPKWGMLLGWGPYLRDIAATGNVIREAETGIAVSVVEGAGRATIRGNAIDGTRRGAVVGHRWNEPATGDLTKPGAAVPENLEIASG